MSLEANDTKTVTFELVKRDVSYWDVVGQKWELAAGSVGVEVGWWVGDIQATGAIAMS